VGFSNTGLNSVKILAGGKWHWRQWPSWRWRERPDSKFAGSYLLVQPDSSQRKCEGMYSVGKPQILY